MDDVESKAAYTAGTATPQTAYSSYVDVHSRRNGKKLFRFDPKRLLIQCGERGEYETIDLTEYMTE